MKFFTDRDLGKRLGRALREVDVEVEMHFERYPGSGNVKDEIWIPEVTADGFVILTHDKHIRRRRAEREAFERAGARVVVFATKSPTPFVHLRALMVAWERITTAEAIHPAPFMFGLQADGRLNQYIPPP